MLNYDNVVTIFRYDSLYIYVAPIRARVSFIMFWSELIGKERFTIVTEYQLRIRTFCEHMYLLVRSDPIVIVSRQPSMWR